MATDEPIPDEDYASADDSDFAPDDAPERASSPDTDDDASTTGLPGAKASGRKRQAGDNEAEDAGFENSGDEAIIEKGTKRQKKAKHTNGELDNEDGGEGGLIKTRSQRAQEKAERKTAAVSGPVTIDVDAVWAQMMADPAVPKPSERTATETSAPADDANMLDRPAAPIDLSAPPASASNMIKIKRTYNFAGKVHAEEKLVARDSAEAKLYLASLGDGAEAEAAAAAAAAEDAEPKRMPRRAFRSAFEPVVDPSPLRTDLNLGMAVRLKAREAKENARKLNTVEKSRMDWVGFVDKEGIQDELDLAGKSKGSFAQRQQFLARAEARREEDARRARIAGKV